MRRTLLGMLGLFGCGSPSAGSMPDAPSEIDAHIELVATIEAPTDLAFDATHVYIAHGGGISRMPKAGGELELIVTDQRGPRGMNVVGDRLFWANSGTHAADFRDGSICSAPNAGGTVVELSTAYFPSGLVIDGTTLYWAELDGQRVRSVAMDSSSPMIVDAAVTSKTSIAITATKLAWTASRPDESVVVMDRAMGTKTEISSQYGAENVVLHGDDVFWHSRWVQSETGAIHVSRNGAPPIDLVADERYPVGLTGDGDTLYWASDKRIRSLPTSGGTPVTLAEGLGDILRVAVDGEYLYWTDFDGGTILRMRR